MTRALVLGMILGLVACSPSASTNDGGGGGGDMAVRLDSGSSPDLPMVAMDLSTDLPMTLMTDLSMTADLLTSPGASDAGSCVPVGGNRQAFVFDTLTLPAKKTDYALDLNGDGKLDNQYGNIIAVINAISPGLNAQTAVDSALANGTLVELIDEVSSDATFTNDACAQSSISHGQNQAPGPPPQTYTIDTGTPTAHFVGPLASSFFDSTAPATGPDVQLTLYLSFFVGAPASVVPLHGAHVQDLYSTGPTLKKGQINGALLMSDFNSKVVPDIAVGLTNQVMAGGTSGMQIAAIFDTGGSASGGTCKQKTSCASAGVNAGDPVCQDTVGPHAGQCAQACDNVIFACEVSTNTTIQGIFKADVQMFQGGIYQPNPANTSPDSISLGVAFTAVQANF
jgi:hypothetical protein